MSVLRSTILSKQDAIRVAAVWQTQVREAKDPVARAALAKNALLNKALMPLVRVEAIDVLLQEAPKVSEQNAAAALDLFRLAASFAVQTKCEAKTLVKWRRCFRALEIRGAEAQLKDASIAFGLSPLGSAFQKMAHHECRRLIRKKEARSEALPTIQIG